VPTALGDVGGGVTALLVCNRDFWRNRTWLERSEGEGRGVGQPKPVMRPACGRKFWREFGEGYLFYSSHDGTTLLNAEEGRKALSIGGDALTRGSGRELPARSRLVIRNGGGSSAQDRR